MSFEEMLGGPRQRPLSLETIGVIPDP